MSKAPPASAKDRILARLADRVRGSGRESQLLAPDFDLEPRNQSQWRQFGRGGDHGLPVVFFGCGFADGCHKPIALLGHRFNVRLAGFRFSQDLSQG